MVTGRDRTNSNDTIYQQVKDILTKEEYEGEFLVEKPPECVRLTEFYDRAKRRMLIKLLTLQDWDPRIYITCDQDTLAPHNFGKKRAGHPRFHWYNNTLKRFWDVDVRATLNITYMEQLNVGNDRHRMMLRNVAQLLRHGELID